MHWLTAVWRQFETLHSSAQSTGGGVILLEASGNVCHRTALIRLNVSVFSVFLRVLRVLRGERFGVF